MLTDKICMYSCAAKLAVLVSHCLSINVAYFNVQSPTDGRRAPVAREFKQRSSVLTQTPPICSTSDTGGSPFVLLSADNGDGFIEFGSKEDINGNYFCITSHSCL